MEKNVQILNIQLVTFLKTENTCTSAQLKSQNLETPSQG